MENGAPGKEMRFDEEGILTPAMTGGSSHNVAPIPAACKIREQPLSGSLLHRRVL